jgi:hypothetical protein
MTHGSLVEILMDVVSHSQLNINKIAIPSQISDEIP